MGKPTNKTYVLSLMVDMFKIPDDRFDEFLIDLKQWHEFGRGFDDIVQTFAKATKETPPKDYMKMKWLDDGKHGMPKVNIYPPPTKGIR